MCQLLLMQIPGYVPSSGTSDESDGRTDGSNLHLVFVVRLQLTGTSVCCFYTVQPFRPRNNEALFSRVAEPDGEFCVSASSCCVHLSYQQLLNLPDATELHSLSLQFVIFLMTCVMFIFELRLMRITNKCRFSTDVLKYRE